MAREDRLERATERAQRRFGVLPIELVCLRELVRVARRSQLARDLLRAGVAHLIRIQERLPHPLCDRIGATIQKEAANGVRDGSVLLPVEVKLAHELEIEQRRRVAPREVARATAQRDAQLRAVIASVALRWVVAACATGTGRLRQLLVEEDLAAERIQLLVIVCERARRSRAERCC